MTFISVRTKEILIERVAELGSLQEALNEYNLSFNEYSDYLEADEEFMTQLKKAEAFYWAEVNKRIQSLGKQRLLQTLQHGITQLTVKTETITLSDGSEATKEVRTKKYLGVPMSAISLALSMIPELEKATQTLITHNALDPMKLEKLQVTLGSFQTELRAVLGSEVSKDGENVEQILATMQKLLVGGSAE